MDFNLIQNIRIPIGPMFLRPRITLGKDEHGAIVVTIDAVLVDEQSQLVKDDAGNPIVQNTETFRMFESGFGKQYISEIAFVDGEGKPAFVIDRDGRRHFHATAPIGLFGADGGPVGCTLSANVK